MSPQSKPIALALITLRRIRTNILNAPNSFEGDEIIEQDFERSMALAHAAASLLVASTLGRNTIRAERKLHWRLAQCLPEYTALQTTSNTNSDPDKNVAELERFATKLNRDIRAGEEFWLSPLGHTSNARDIHNELDRYGIRVAPLATDLVTALTANGLIAHYFGRRFDVYPVVPDTRGKHAILPAVVPPIQNYYHAIYLDGEGGGNTLEAVSAALKRNLDFALMMGEQIQN